MRLLDYVPDTLIFSFNFLSSAEERKWVIFSFLDQLLENGVIDLTDRTYNTPLIDVITYPCFNFKSFIVMKWLLNQKQNIQDVNEISRDGETALFAVVVTQGTMNNYKQNIINFLLEKGADPFQQIDISSTLSRYKFNDSSRNLIVNSTIRSVFHLPFSYESSQHNQSLHERFIKHFLGTTVADLTIIQDEISYMRNYITQKYGQIPKFNRLEFEESCIKCISYHKGPEYHLDAICNNTYKFYNKALSLIGTNKIIFSSQGKQQKSSIKKLPEDIISHVFSFVTNVNLDPAIKRCKLSKRLYPKI